MTTPSSASRVVWQDPRELSAGFRPAGDEFTPDVAQAVAELRSRHGLDGAAPAPSAIDAFRREVKDLLPGVNRRGFFQLTGAAAVFALTGCYGKHPDTIVGHADQPDGTTIGNATWYSTTLRASGWPVPVMVKCYDGRPIKIEGNPDHPLTRGRADARTQAALLDLYDPDRIQTGPEKRQDDRYVPTGWDALDTAVGTALKTGGVGLITGPIDGPASSKVVREFLAACEGRAVHGECLAWPRTRAPEGLAAAAVLVGFGGDPLAQWPVEDLVAFGAFRKLRGTAATADCGQLIAVEAVMSQTGACADVRVRCHPDQLAAAAWQVAARLAKLLNDGDTAALAAKAIAVELPKVGTADAADFIAERLAAAKKAGRKGLISIAADAGAELRAAAAAIDRLLGNTPTLQPRDDRRQEALRQLLARCAAGEIATLIISGVNPAYLLGHDAIAMQALATVKTLVVLDDRFTETARRAHWVAPTLHDLESWGDANGSRDGRHLTVQQPCIQPLWNARAWGESLMAFAVAAGIAPRSFTQRTVAGDGKAVAVISRQPLYAPAAKGVQSWAAYVRKTWTGEVARLAGTAADNETTFWQAALARGVVVLPARHGDAESPLPAAATTAPAAARPLALVLTPSRALGADGRTLNNPWLQELPDPVSKVTWDNYLAISPVYAAEHGLREDDVVQLSVGTRRLRLPVHVQEGQHPAVVETFLGWGREPGCAGAVADLGIQHGFSINAWPLTGDAADIRIEATGERYQLAVAQGHQRMEGRDLAREDVLELHQRDPGGVKRRTRHAAWEKGSDGKPAGRLSAFGASHQSPGHKWGMAIDLSLCTGCNACVVACNAENNVPVVGRDEVRKGRIMHWMRVDRYYSSVGGDQLDVEVLHQPVMCQQCDHAPCEEVCPAMATVHNDEGQNIMVYNRCIGTRYCSNNCPYKVRRFNWYEYSKYRAGPINSGEPVGRILKNVVTDGRTSSQAELTQAPLQLLLNPEVTVRSRGVMEKCNFCLQRTRAIREREKAQNRRLPDGAVTSACAQTCPTDAIVFGDLNDPESAVSRLAAQVHGYKLLDAELNTRPSVTYLAKIRNRPVLESDHVL